MAPLFFYFLQGEIKYQITILTGAFKSIMYHYKYNYNLFAALIITFYLFFALIILFVPINDVLHAKHF